MQGNLQPLPMIYFPQNLIKTHNGLLINTCNISKIKNRTDRLSTILRQCNHQLTSKLWITNRSSEYQITLYLCCEKPVSFLWKLNWNAHWIFFIYFYYYYEGIKQLWCDTDFQNILLIQNILAWVVFQISKVLILAIWWIPVHMFSFQIYYHMVRI